MSKTIKLDDRVYSLLEELRDKRETFSQAVEKLLFIRARLDRLLGVIDGRISAEEHKRREPEPMTAARAERTRPG